MATLEIDLNCMCLLVPDPRPGIVHVLMPCTHGAAEEDLHIVRMDYADREGNNVTRRLEGWLLEVGDVANPSARLDDDLTFPDNPQIVNLSDRTGDRVPASMLQDDPAVVTRLTFYGGRIVSVQAQNPDWLLGEDRVYLAHKIVWRLAVDEEDQIRWTRLGARQSRHCETAGEGDGSSPALPALADLQLTPAWDGGAPDDDPQHALDGDEAAPGAVEAASQEEKQVYALHIHHVAKQAVLEGDNGPPLTNVLDERQIQEHFRMFYDLLRTPKEKADVPVLPPEVRKEMEDPDNIDAGGPGWACKMARAEVG